MSLEYADSGMDAASFIPPMGWEQMDQSTHSVHFYDEDSFLVERISRFLGSAIVSGRSAVFLAAADHIEAVEQALADSGLAVADLKAQSRMISMDVDTILHAITTDNLIDRDKFRTLVGDVLTRASISSGGRPAAVYGEIVADLCARGQPDQALYLESLWNEVATEYSFHLRCAYPLRLFAEWSDELPLHGLCAEHSHVIPTERFTELHSEDEKLRAILMLQHKDLVLQTQLEERTRLLLAEEEARFAAEAALRLRDEFVNLASHELRTPVSLVKGSAQLLLRHGTQQPEMMERTLKVIEQSANRLAGVIDDLLDVTNLQAGELALTHEVVDLVDVIETAVLSQQYEDHAPAIRWIRRPVSATIVGDKARLIQIFSQVLGNALKFSNNLAVEVGLSERTDGYLVSIADQGIGLPPGSESMVFEPFGRATNGSYQRAGGLGLGLYISRRLVEAHGGRIWIRSRGEGKGATIKVWLPLSSTSDVPVPAIPEAIGAA